MAIDNHARTKRADGTSIVGPKKRAGTGPGPHIMALSGLDGKQVLSTDGDEVGHIQDVMLDIQRGSIAYAVLASGGFLDRGDRLLAIPWCALTLDAERKCFHVGISSAKIRGAPDFDMDAWPSMSDGRWASEVHQYYGRDPYWGAEVLEAVNLSGTADLPEAGGSMP